MARYRTRRKVTIKNPGDPTTPRQLSYLADLAEALGEPAPTPATQGEASTLIDQLKSELGGTVAFDRGYGPRQRVHVTRFASGHTQITNARGRCIDAPCCGCCTY